METIQKKRCRSKQAQINALINFMAAHTEFATGRQTTYNDNIWHRLRLELAEFGPDKSPIQWKHTWRDLKRKARMNRLTPRVDSIVARVLDIIEGPHNQTELFPDDSPEPDDDDMPEISPTPGSSFNSDFHIKNEDILNTWDADQVPSNHNESKNTESAQATTGRSRPLKPASGGFNRKPYILIKHFQPIPTEEHIVERKRCRPKQIQIDAMIEFMERHADLASGRMSHPQGAVLREKLWKQLTVKLGKLGPVKSVQQWKITWRDLKRKARSQSIYEETNAWSFQNTRLLPSAKNVNDVKTPGIKNNQTVKRQRESEEMDVSVATATPKSSAYNESFIKVEGPWDSNHAPDNSSPHRNTGDSKRPESPESWRASKQESHNRNIQESNIQKILRIIKTPSSESKPEEDNHMDSPEHIDSPVNSPAAGSSSNEDECLNEDPLNSSDVNQLHDHPVSRKTKDSLQNPKSSDASKQNDSLAVLVELHKKTNSHLEYISTNMEKTTDVLTQILSLLRRKFTD